MACIVVRALTVVDVSQLSFFSAESVPPAVSDLTGVLAAAGQIVTARARPYGLEFARSDSGRGFFLVLDDDWARDVPSHAVML